MRTIILLLLAAHCAFAQQSAAPTARQSRNIPEGIVARLDIPYIP